MSNDLDFEAWIQRAKTANIVEVAQGMGAKLRRQGHEWIGACPVGCCTTDGFAISSKDRVFICRKGDAQGDIISMVGHLRGLDPKDGKEFVAICEEILGEPPPRGESRVQPRDPGIDKERREERKAAEIERQMQEKTELEIHIEKATALFNTGVAIEGTLAEDYFEEWRKLDLLAFSPHDLRYRNALDYWGFPGIKDVDEDGESYPPDKKIKLGSFPAILAAMRDLEGRITGVKRIYLDRKGKKLKPPGSTKNKAKLGTYTMGGSLVYLDQIGELLALGEGVETSVAYKMLARRGHFGDAFAPCTIAAADSLGNMASEELRLPPQVKRLILVGDSDSDPKATRAALAKAGAHHRARGIEVHVHMAPAGVDWADVVAEMAREAA
jgi:hypothetical protein